MGDFNLMGAVAKAAILFPPFLLALCCHEFAHGWEARRRGDRTAEMMGRLTLNPMAHMDIIGTVILPLMGFMGGLPFVFGWAKPVPVNSRNLDHVVKDMFWIAAAGPLSNVLLAVISSILLIVLSGIGVPKQVMMMLLTFGMVNIILAVFNMIPLHPLDGGKVLARFLPTSWNEFLEAHQGANMFILLGLMLTGVLAFIINLVSRPYLYLLLDSGVDVNSLLYEIRHLGQG